MDKEHEHYVGAVGKLSANVAELNGVVVMLLTVLQTRQSDLPQTVALIVDSRVAFYKTQECTEQENGQSKGGQKQARLSALGRYVAMLIECVNQLGVAVYWVWSKGHSGGDRLHAYTSSKHATKATTQSKDWQMWSTTGLSRWKGGCPAAPKHIHPAVYMHTSTVSRSVQHLALVAFGSNAQSTSS